jgi:hypothetical protein
VHGFSNQGRPTLQPFPGTQRFPDILAGRQMGAIGTFFKGHLKEGINKKHFAMLPGQLYPPANQDPVLLKCEILLTPLHDVG